MGPPAKAAVARPATKSAARRRPARRDLRASHRPDLGSAMLALGSSGAVCGFAADGSAAVARRVLVRLGSRRIRGIAPPVGARHAAGLDPALLDRPPHEGEEGVGVRAGRRRRHQPLVAARSRAPSRGGRRGTGPRSHPVRHAARPQRELPLGDSRGHAEPGPGRRRAQEENDVLARRVLREPRGPGIIFRVPSAVSRGVSRPNCRNLYSPDRSPRIDSEP